MKRSDFNFDLPDELIAQTPSKKRSDSRLLLVDGKKNTVSDSSFPQLIDVLHPGDLLVFNNTKVIAARLYGEKSSGGKIEALIERIINPQRVFAKIKASKSPKDGAKLILGTDHPQLDGFSVEVIGRHDDLFELHLGNQENIFSLLETYGHIPLPPYVKRADNKEDSERYQTIYAKELGAVAAPTAGLHFDKQVLSQLKAKGVKFAYVTLHVGAGTYQPVRADNIKDHIMHSEYVKVTDETVKQILATKQQGHRVIAVGTTSLRSLESAAAQATSDCIETFEGDTDIFIFPGYQFKIIDALITNFHLPESTLFMLVSAFTNLPLMQQAYQHAIKQKYRFFSYGDSMFITPSLNAKYLKD